jgi:hypothetical protein
MGEEKDLTGAALICAADRVVELVEQDQAFDEWMKQKFYAEGGELTQ